MFASPYKYTLALIISALALSFGSSTSSAQTLLSHYTLDGTASDSGSIGADGSLSGGATYVSDAPGNYATSLDVTGTGSRYLEANVGSAYSGLEQLTITLWINMQGSASNNDRLVSNMEASTFDSFDLRYSTTVSPNGFRTNYNVNTTGSPALSDSMSANNSWTFIAVTYDNSLGSNQVSYYTGNESTSVGLLNVASQSGALNDSSLFRIGSTAASGSDRTPPAYFSDVRVYNGVLNGSQLESIRNEVFVVPESKHYAMVLAFVSIAALVVRRRSRSA